MTTNTPSQKNVLLVEDSAVAREKIGGVLKELGCMVIASSNGAEGLKKAQQRAIDLDLVVLDIQMPQMDGITMLRYLRQMPLLKDLPVVMLTTQSDQDTVRKALSFKANDYIRKDAPLAEITERLRKHLA